MQREIDNLAISFATGRSRRDALRKLAIGAIGVPVAALGGLGLTETEATKKKGKKDKKNDKKKITLCHKGQTITVSKKAKKAHLRHGDTLGPCQDTPPCTPEANPCGRRKCGSVDNGCGQQVSCGNCTAPEICNTTTGQCGCTPDNNPCAGRVCGTVNNSCGQPVNCGPNNGGCSGADTCNASGQCTCTPTQNPCAGRQCGSVDNGCGQLVNCGPNNGSCTGTDTCNASGQCICIPNSNACTGRECGTVDNGCGQQITCGVDNGACPAAPECNSAGICGNNGQCTYAIADAEIGSPCGQADTGVCVQNGDGSGSCVITNNGTNNCIGADPCGIVNAPRQCATANGYDNGDCGCYSTVEQGGICLRRNSSFAYPSSAVGCFGTTIRPACNTSADCASGSVCAPLDELGTSTGTCCAGYDGFRGACVQIATDICSAPPA